MQLRFICNGDARTGFGHVARCIALAELCRQRLPGANIAFCGSYSPSVVCAIRREVVDVRIDKSMHGDEADVTIVDRLGHPDVLNSIPEEIVDWAARRSRRVVLLASGTVRLPTPENGICIGYQPDGPRADPPRLLWGFEYAPVSPLVALSPPAVRGGDSVLVAFGAHTNAAALQMTCRVLREMPSIARIVVLQSQAAGENDLPALGAHQHLEIIQGPDEVALALRRAAIVVASFGNLGYEALTAGAPLVLLAQKQFQHDLARAFAARGLAVDAGITDDGDEKSLTDSIVDAFARASELSAAGSEAVDGRGLFRIADHIANACTEAGSYTPADRLAWPDMRPYE